MLLPLIHLFGLDQAKLRLVVETLDLALEIQTFSKKHYLEFMAPQTNVSSKSFKFIL